MHIECFCWRQIILRTRWAAITLTPALPVSSPVQAQSCASSPGVDGLRDSTARNPMWVTRCLLRRAFIYRMQGDFARAQDMSDQTDSKLKGSVPPGNIAFASLLSERALLAQAHGNLSAASDLMNQALGHCAGIGERRTRRC